MKQPAAATGNSSSTPSVASVTSDAGSSSSDAAAEQKRRELKDDAWHHLCTTHEQILRELYTTGSLLQVFDAELKSCIISEPRVMAAGGD